MEDLIGSFFSNTDYTRKVEDDTIGVKASTLYGHFREYCEAERPDIEVISDRKFHLKLSNGPAPSTSAPLTETGLSEVGKKYFTHRRKTRLDNRYYGVELINV